MNVSKQHRQGCCGMKEERGEKVKEFGRRLIHFYVEL
jgi:hypothetical protein